MVYISAIKDMYDGATESRGALVVYIRAIKDMYDGVKMQLGQWEVTRYTSRS